MNQAARLFALWRAEAQVATHQLAERFGHCELVADATLKVISTLKVLAKDHSVSPAILEELKTN